MKKALSLILTCAFMLASNVRIGFKYFGLHAD